MLYVNQFQWLLSTVQVSTERYEQEMADLKKTMTVKMIKKKEAMSMRLQSKAQLQTATLVKKHSEQMLELLKSKQEELKQELVDEIVSFVYSHHASSRLYTSRLIRHHSSSRS